MVIMWSTAKAFLVICTLVVVEFMEILAETCEKIDNCSCKKSSGKVINLREVDGGSKGPAFKGIPTIIPTGSNYAFNWNPCTDFTEGNGCTDVLLCQYDTTLTSQTYPCADTASEFKVNSDGSTAIIYQPKTSDIKRSFEITLKCDEAEYPGETDGVKEVHDTQQETRYAMVFKSKCACDDGCVSNNPPSGSGSTGISVGSILLIVFFTLLPAYLIGGILTKKDKMGVDSMPEMVPNYEFWAGLPYLVKDGIVFTCKGLKSGCTFLYHKCNKDGYADI